MVVRKTEGDIANNIRFVLVEPSHPGNIGAVARAMKTMGLTKLYLVKPEDYPNEVAVRRAVGAMDVLDNAVVCDSLAAAVADCSLVVGTSVRSREVSWSLKEPAAAAIDVVDVAAITPVAIVFGRERSGLDNEEMDQTRLQIMIPSNPDFSSLNLASAAQIIAYEIRKRVLLFEEESAGAVPNEEHSSKDWEALASHGDLVGMYEHIEETLYAIEFIKTRPATKLMRKVIRLFSKADVTVEELQIIRGVMTSASYAAQGDARWKSKSIE
jgi:tRNA (cytidine32/uridine32-2'-O)-methyltransferase